MYFRKFPRVLAVFCFVLVTAVPDMAKTPAQLKADLSTILPQGQKARMVWQQGGTWTKPGYLDLYVVDSDSGVIRKLNTTAIDAQNPHLTADGSRVIFGDQLSGRIYIINWDGTNLRIISNSGRYLEYWQNPADKSDWAVYCGQYGNPVSRINVDTKVIVQLYNGSMGASGSPIMGISQDGTHLSAYFEQRGGGWDPGVVLTSGSALPVFSVKKGGCGMGMTPDNTYDYFVHWSRLGNGHHGIQFYNKTSAKDTFTIDDGILAWARANNMDNGCGQNQEFQNAKMTNNRNFVTFGMFFCKANPFIVRLSDRKWVSIDDQLGCNYVHGLDVCFFQPPSSGTISKPSALQGLKGQSRADAQVYGIDGRRSGVASRMSKTSTSYEIMLVGHGSEKQVYPTVVLSRNTR